MSTGYFARVVDGIVDAVIKADPWFVAENPILFSENWIEVPDMDHYPAMGWSWTLENGFTPPPVDLSVQE